MCCSCQDDVAGTRFALSADTIKKVDEIACCSGFRCWALAAQGGDPQKGVNGLSSLSDLASGLESISRLQC